MFPTDQMTLPASGSGNLGFRTQSISKNIVTRLRRWRLNASQRRAIAQLPDSDSAQLARLVRCLDKSDIVREYRSDPWLCNYFVNWWEYVHGETVLSSYPWNVTIPIADVCNARCTFCSSWLEGTRVLELAEVPRFGDVLRFARLLGIAGHGEPLAHPQCEELFHQIAEYLDPRCESYLITNGVFLERRADVLRRLNVRTYNISLNAASSATHDVVMGLGPDAFETILKSIRRLIAESRTLPAGDKRGIDVNISFVINRDNVHETAEFIRLGNELGVNAIYLRTLNNISSLSPGLNYHLLPPTLHPQFDLHASEAKQAIAASKAKIITDEARWSAPVLSKDLADLVQIQPPATMPRKDALKDGGVRQAYASFYEGLGGSGQPLSGPDAAHDPMDDGANPFDRKAPYYCYFVYHDFILNDFNLRLIPCCYMSNVPGHEVVRFDGTRPFLELWNSPAFVSLRRRLQQGPLFGACKKCPAQDVPF